MSFHLETRSHPLSMFRFRSLLLPLALAALLPGARPIQDGDLAERVEKALQSRVVEDLRAACSRTEEAAVQRPKDANVQALLARLYAAAGATPLAVEAADRAREADPLVRLPELQGARFKRLDDFKHQEFEVRAYAREETGDLHLAFFKDSRLAFSLLTEGKGLLVRVEAFGPIRGLALLDSTELPAVRKAVDQTDGDRRLLEQIEGRIRHAATSENPGEVLTSAARTLTEALGKTSARICVLEELWWIYDRLGEFVAGTSRESEYRRRELAVSASLAEAAPQLSTTRRALALTYFRIGAFPLAAAEAGRAPADPLATSLLEVLTAWGQADHRRSEPFEIADGGYRVEPFEAKNPPPDSNALFPEWTFIVRKGRKADFAVYTFCSQKLKTSRHYYIYVQYLSDRTLLTSYGDKRPDNVALNEKIVSLLRRLGENPGKGK